MRATHKETMIALIALAAALAGSICNDGTYSSSEGQGTCSYHGGVDYSGVYPQYQTPTPKPTPKPKEICVHVDVTLLIYMEEARTRVSFYVPVAELVSNSFTACAATTQEAALLAIKKSTPGMWAQTHAILDKYNYSQQQIEKITDTFNGGDDICNVSDEDPLNVYITCGLSAPALPLDPAL